MTQLGTQSNVKQIGRSVMDGGRWVVAMTVGSIKYKYKYIYMLYDNKDIYAFVSINFIKSHSIIKKHNGKWNEIEPMRDYIYMCWKCFIMDGWEYLWLECQKYPQSTTTLLLTYVRKKLTCRISLIWPGRVWWCMMWIIDRECLGHQCVCVCVGWKTIRRQISHTTKAIITHSSVSLPNFHIYIYIYIYTHII